MSSDANKWLKAAAATPASSRLSRFENELTEAAEEALWNVELILAPSP